MTTKSMDEGDGDSISSICIMQENADEEENLTM